MAKDVSILADVRGESSPKSASGKVLAVRGQKQFPTPHQSPFDRVPTSYPSGRFLVGWGKTRDIANVPSVIGRDITTGGGGRTLSPSIVNDVNIRGSTELKMQDRKMKAIESSPSPKSRRDALRLSSPFFVQRARETIASNLGLIQRRLRQR